MGRGARRFVEDLLGGRRPRSFAAKPEDAGELRAAITLRAAAPGADAPSADFVADLHRRLAAASTADAAPAGAAAHDLAPSEPAPDRLASARPAPGRPAPGRLASGRRGGPAGSRRGFVTAGSLAAAAATVGGAVGAGLDRVLTSGGTAASQVAADRVLVPTTGTWKTVTTSQELPEGGVTAFQAGSVIGFVRRSGGTVSAVSGVCTHQGCELQLDPAVRRLNCPCHRTVFELSGQVLRSQLKVQPRPLPEIQVREVAGVVQVFTPPRPA